MKKLFTLLLILFINSVSFSQGPVIEGTYYPVRNTKIKQIWDTTQGVIAVPAMGPNQIWDYTQANGQFINLVDTFNFEILDPASTPYSQYFPGSSLAVFMRTPMPNDAFDSLFLYFKVDQQQGLNRLGGFNIKNMYDSTIKFTTPEFFSPPLMSYGYTHTDTSRSVTYVNHYLGQKGKVKKRTIKTFTYTGYGTLKLPNHTYNNVAQIREVYSTIDSIFVDLLSNGNYIFYTTKLSQGKVYDFYRNNTFGSTFLMWLNVNPANTIVEQAWFTLPADFGSITGTVFTNTLETTPVTNGNVYLYRENSNIKRNDILAIAKLDPNGNYKFDSIPYGEYRFAVRPDTSIYPNAMITYLGDKTDWLQATTIITTTSTSTGHKIHLQNHNGNVGLNAISGQIGLNLNIMRAASSTLLVKPIPSIGIVVKKNPGTGAERVLVTDTAGKFNFTLLEDGNYTMFVDIPGLHMAGTYSFSVLGGNVVNGLDFTVGTDSIHPINSAVLGIKEAKSAAGSFINAYPNPYNSFATIVLNLPESANVLLEVYNMLGEKVQILDNSFKQTGNYKYTFSAKSLNYSSGMYFVKLTAGNKTNVLKIVEQ